jgi:hypothetical protein
MEPFGVVFSKLLTIILQSFEGRGDLTIKGKPKNLITLMIRHPYLNDDRKNFLSSFVNINQVGPFGVVFSKLLTMI